MIRVGSRPRYDVRPIAMAAAACERLGAVVLEVTFEVIRKAAVVILLVSLFVIKVRSELRGCGHTGHC